MGANGSGPIGRLRAFAGQIGLLAVLGLMAAALVTGAPRLANEYADRGLGADVAGLPYLVRDIMLPTSVQPGPLGDPGAGTANLPVYRDAMPQPLPRLIGDQWYSASVGPVGLSSSGDFIPFNGSAGPSVGIRAQTGVREAVRMVSGVWPDAAGRTPAGRIAIVVSEPTADTLSLRLGSHFGINAAPGTPPVAVEVVGIFAALDPSAPVWNDMRLALEPLVPLLDGDRFQALVVTDWAGMGAVDGRLGQFTYQWHYRIDEHRLNSGDIESLTAALVRLKRVPPLAGAPVATSLDASLIQFQERLASVRALLGVVQAGVLASLVGLILLAARLSLERRREELALLRARGASTLSIGTRTLAESVLVQPFAMLAGWLLGTLVPGRPAGTEWLVPVLAVLTTVAVPLLAMSSQRRVTFVVRRQDLVRQRPSARRLTAEISVLGLAALGVFLLRRRGLAPDGGLDPYLVSVPVLLATGTALIALRLLPWPLRILDRVAARTRGSVLFLGLARAGRGAPVTIGPLAVLVVAITTGVFSGVVAGTISHARDQVTERVVPADADLVGGTFATTTADRLRELPGVDAVTGVALENAQHLLSGTGVGAEDLGQAQVVVVDVPAFVEVMRRSGVPDDAVPAALRRATRGEGPVPAVVSPAIAASVGDGAVADVQGRFYAFTPSVVADTFPGVKVGVERFVVLPWQALPVPDFKPIMPNRYLVAGDDFDRAALLRTADDGQREWRSGVLGRPVTGVAAPAELVTRSEYRTSLDRTGGNELLSLAFLIGALGGTGLALLAVGFAVLAEARTRGRVLSRLRTMGLSGRQGRQLLVYELLPLIGAAVLAGGLVGVALPGLIGPALNLSTFTSGVAARTHLDPLLVGGVLLLVVVGLAAALVIENLVNRRMRLGEVLRLGEEN
ncbi:ABC transporter permease [Micromonospora sp. NBC_01699]|uniref:FtsX-like permease family protein n=1 Tax=Micromonospora sp. NBC_01699 TaxID=2975984 RepID=UPI002E2DDD72|nr:FtsX-like permease family protein [Micromonospora sp. NBC_01699]